MVENEELGIMSNNKTALVTGAAGFIGFSLSKTLLQNGWTVIGVDCLSDYYDINLKKDREAQLIKFPNYRSIHKKIEERGFLMDLFSQERPEIIIHLAAQAGVRNSIENPREYLESNICGTFELLEAARTFRPNHMLLASTSSAYGANTVMPFHEKMKADTQISFYAATKKATENIAHSYSHLFGLPITMFRFFTVYGPWGRPDMALFKFTKAILEGKPIDIYNNGNMTRDFTYITDLVSAIQLLIDANPSNIDQSSCSSHDSKSSVAPFRIVNIGNSKPVPLLEFIEAIEKFTGKKAIRNLMPMQAGDVSSTWADISLLQSLTGYNPSTDVENGVKSFISWYKKYYGL